MQFLALSRFFFFNDTATTEIYTLSLHDALPIGGHLRAPAGIGGPGRGRPGCRRSEEHTSELQSRRDRVCRLLLEKKKSKESGVGDSGREKEDGGGPEDEGVK